MKLKYMNKNRKSDRVLNPFLSFFSEAFFLCIFASLRTSEFRMCTWLSAGLGTMEYISFQCHRLWKNALFPMFSLQHLQQMITGFVKYYIVLDTMPFPVSHDFFDSTIDEKKVWNWTQVFRKTAYDLYLLLKY